LFHFVKSLTVELIYLTTYPLLVSCDLLLPICINVQNSAYQSCKNCSYKDRWDKANVKEYYDYSGLLFQSINTPKDIIHCPLGCKCVLHYFFIETYYDQIVSSLKKASSRFVPRLPYNWLKAYWNEHLNNLKEQCCDLHKLWRQINSPRSGCINDARLAAKRKYKLAIKEYSIIMTINYLVI